MKKILSLLLCALLMLSAFSAVVLADGEDAYALDEEYYSKFKGQNIKLYVYNWGEYIADGADGSRDVIAWFEELTGIDVEYTTFDTNEGLYSKLQSGSAYYDIVIPSDYMVSRLAEQGMLEKLDYSNIPNFEKYIDEAFRSPDYDAAQEYSVTYTWGTVGIIYNTKYIDAVDSWSALWNEDYAGKILMFDNSRDAFGIAQYLLGYDVNTTDEQQLQACAEKLAEQKPVLQQYVMDQIYETMENEEAWIAPYYVGDCLTMMENNENLAFYLPEQQGFNLFIDAMCIPKCAREKEAAELFINFMCQPEIAAANMEWVCYSTPLSAAKEFLDEETVNNPVAYPGQEVLENGTSFAYLPETTTQLVERLFMQVKTNALE
jgi:spermidine/putrescine transport system substrate-binding protein